MTNFASNRPRLAFVNRARTYQPIRGAVCFWANDGPREVTFYVSAGALKQLDVRLKSDETGFLRAFDTHRGAIEDAASNIYRPGSQSSYELDFNHF